MPTWHYIKNEISNSIINEKCRLPLFFPVILGIGILLGVYYPVTTLLYLYIFIFGIIIISFIIFKFYFISKILILFILGFYISQTGGILKTDLLVNKQFITNQYNRISFYADVDYIDEDAFNNLMTSVNKMNMALFNFIQYLKAAEIKGSKYRTNPKS